ncbi:hypothetical protein EYF80_014750 [Liparis tanakae]|uniref:Uncharacterized protein n=1 Tax=Liparis tanakae TaxID=230148 RepID=A0A4Z2ICC5_9TELE|nr:hypothetical protein EYF80_014750 [Liparis tanakae]
MDSGSPGLGAMYPGPNKQKLNLPDHDPDDRKATLQTQSRRFRQEAGTQMQRAATHSQPLNHIHEARLSG